jgi:hypothetical protein
MDSPGAPASIEEVPCKPRDNFFELAEVAEGVRKKNREVVIICAGLLSRPLVHTLVEDGFRAYDIGHLGLWFRNGTPIPLQDCPR